MSCGNSCQSSCKNTSYTVDTCYSGQCHLACMGSIHGICNTVTGCDGCGGGCWATNSNSGGGGGDSGGGDSGGGVVGGCTSGSCSNSCVNNNIACTSSSCSNGCLHSCWDSCDENCYVFCDGCSQTCQGACTSCTSSCSENCGNYCRGSADYGLEQYYHKNSTYLKPYGFEAKKDHPLAEQATRFQNAYLYENKRAGINKDYRYKTYRPGEIITTDFLVKEVHPLAFGLVPILPNEEFLIDPDYFFTDEYLLARYWDYRSRRQPPDGPQKGYSGNENGQNRR